MHILSQKSDLDALLAPLRAAGKTIGFVPTMGALHNGHLNLVRRAVADCDVAVCSIFVNPTQFNNANDLKAYPRMPEQDLALLKQAGCFAVYMPEEKDLYPNGTHSEPYNFGAMETVMEGKYRPGHFAGVATVVNLLFAAVAPHRAYFGEKDFQQLTIIKQLVKQENLVIAIVPCPTEREADGLAMSSRNLRLTAAQRHAAPAIFQNLLNLKEMIGVKELAKARIKTIESINAHPELAVEYLEIADAETLQPIAHWSDANSARAFAAVYAGEVRLIDNILLF